MPIWARPSQEQAIALLLVYAIVAVSLLILTGWAGQISLGQFALVGIGGATTGILYATARVGLPRRPPGRDAPSPRSRRW